MSITIAEEVLLLGYREDTGRPLVGQAELDSALAGAVLAELALHDRIELADQKVVVRDPTPLGDAELDAALARIAAEKRHRKPDWWVYRLRTGLRERLLERLVGRGALTEQRSKVLGLFTVRRYPEQDARLERLTRERLGAVLAGAEPDARTAVTVAILDAARILKKVFPYAAKTRVKEIVDGDWAGAAVAKTIAAINAAAAAAITAAVAAGAAGSGS